jgi:hypothetical protein
MKAFLIGFAELDEQQFDVSSLTPLGEGARGEFAPVVDAQSARFTVQLDELLHQADDPPRRDRRRDFDAQRFPIALIDHVQRLNRPSGRACQRGRQLDRGEWLHVPDYGVAVLERR